MYLAVNYLHFYGEIAPMINNFNGMGKKNTVIVDFKKPPTNPNM